MSDAPSLGNLNALLFDDKLGEEHLAQMEESEATRRMPGALNMGWDYYVHFVQTQHSEWVGAFNTAEEQRRNEEKLWREHYAKVYEEDQGWAKKIVQLALNAIQLWALWKQFRQQKEIAKRTYDLANRQVQIAEELYDFYKTHYYPQEVAVGRQIDDSNYCADYDGTGARFETNIRTAFARARQDWLRCTSSHCGGITHSRLKNFDIELAQAIGNARNHAYRYEELMKETRYNQWLEWRMKYIQIGRDIASQGQNGVMKAFNTFSAFGADPGAALGQLLGTISYTLGSQQNQSVNTLGEMPDMQNLPSLVYQPWLNGIKLNGDLQPAKATKLTRNN